MPKDDGLLDQMLDSAWADQAKTQTAAEDVQQRLDAWPQDVEELGQLRDTDLRKVLAETSSDDLVCVVAEGSEALRTAVGRQLDPESFAWLRGNLEAWEPATRSLRESSRTAMLKVVHRLLKEGQITRPQSAARAAQALEQRDTEELHNLRYTLLAMVTAAAEHGVSALAGVLDNVQHPLIDHGIRSLLESKGHAMLERSLRERQEALIEHYRAELATISDAILSIERGDSPQVYADRHGLETQTK